MMKGETNDGVARETHGLLWKLYLKGEMVMSDMKKGNLIGWMLVGWTVIPGLIACAMQIKTRDNLRATQAMLEDVVQTLHEQDIIQIKG